MSSDQTRPILCGKCRVAAKLRIEADGRETVVCGSCGQEDGLEDASREAVDQLMSKMVRDAMGPDRTSGSDFVKMTITGPPERSYRWVFG